MAYFKITQSKKGELQAKIQVSGKDSTGKSKLFVKRLYNTDGLTEAKFRKQVERFALDFEEEVAKASREVHDVVQEERKRVLTFTELMTEWKAHVKLDLSVNYFERAEEVERRFTEFLIEQELADKPLSEITVRDVQKFLNSFQEHGVRGPEVAKLKKDLPKQVNFRELAREHILSRCSSHRMKKLDANIDKLSAEHICEKYGLDFGEYFELVTEYRPYSVETVKGYRRVLRTLFNEAIRYEWIVKNPVCATKVGAGSSNTTLRPVSEKEVFTIKEARAFIEKLNGLPAEEINRRVPLKFMLLTGVRNAEMCGLRWSDIDFEKKVVHIRRNRLYNKSMGVYEKTPKTQTSARDIPLTDALIEDLKEYMAWFREADRSFDEHLDEYYLASNLYREPLSPQRLGVWLRNFEREWGMKFVTCHGLRHTYCSLLLSQSVPIQTVSKYMGHSDSTITLKVYSHFIPDTQEKALFALNKIL